MASLIPSKAPNLPIATVGYEPKYQDQLNNVFRLYFNTIDNAVAEVIRILNFTGPFDTIYANTVQATTVNATTGNITTLNSTTGNINTANLNTANIQDATISNGNINVADINNLVANVGNIAALTSTTINSGTVNAGTVNSDYVNILSLAAIFAAIQQLQANTVAAANFQGGNGVFNQLTGSNVNASLFTGSGRQINFPHIAASDSTDQVAGGNDTPTVVEWNTLDSGLGWTLNSPGSATADYAGVYKITYSLQFINTANAIHYAYVWMQVNGSDVANSTTAFMIPARKNATDFGYVCGYSEVTFIVAAGDEIELYWATDQAGNPTTPTDGVYIYHEAAQVSPPYDRPAIPSAIGSIVYLSAPPDPLTQITPIGVAGYGGVEGVSLLATRAVTGVSGSGSIGTITVVIT